GNVGALRIDEHDVADVDGGAAETVGEGVEGERDEGPAAGDAGHRAREQVVDEGDGPARAHDATGEPRVGQKPAIGDGGQLQQRGVVGDVELERVGVGDAGERDGDRDALAGQDARGGGLDGDGRSGGREGGAAHHHEQREGQGPRERSGHGLHAYRGHALPSGRPGETRARSRTSTTPSPLTSPAALKPGSPWWVPTTAAPAARSSHSTQPLPVTSPLTQVTSAGTPAAGPTPVDTGVHVGGLGEVRGGEFTAL